MNDSQLRPIIGRASGFILAILLVSVMTTILFFLRDGLNTSTVAVLYLIPVLASTTLWGLWAGILSALAAFLAYNYFFLLPYYTLEVHQSQDIIALLIFLVVAVLNSQLVGRARSSLAEAVARENEIALLYELSLELAGVNHIDEIASVIARKTAETIHTRHLELSIRPFNGGEEYRLSIPQEPKPQVQPTRVIPMKTVRADLGEIRLWLNGAEIIPSEERLLKAYAAQGALALERTALAFTESRARVLEESDRLKSALLTSVSHEFRTPLATIKAATTSLLSDAIPWEEPARVELLTAMDEEADYLNYLVGNLLDMSRIEAGALKPNLQWNILSEIVEGVLVRLYRPLNRFEVNVSIPDDFPLIPVDYSQMEQVFMNLLNNSMKYAPENTVIQIDAVVTGVDSFTVTVRNEGPQVMPDHLDRIFDKFYRVTEPEKVSGTGLGLSICKGIVEAHGGRIWAENVPGGFAFNFALPLTLDGAPPPMIEAENL